MRRERIAHLKAAMSKWRPKPIVWVGAWRWKRAEERRLASLAGYRTKVQVCPRGCEYSELARRDLFARTKWLGRAGLHVVFVFETTNCPKCGARLARECARCKHAIYAPVVDRCQFCGLPQPWASERREGVERTSVRLWHRDQAQIEKRPVNDPALCLYKAPGRGDLWVIDGDIARLAVDAVVSNDDVDGQMWAEVARAIKRAAGEGVELLAQANKPYALGQAWKTSAGALEKVKGIIHVASMTRNGESTIDSVKESLLAAYVLAAREGYESVGVGAMGSGPAAIPPVRWFRAFAQVSVGHLSEDELWETGPKPLSVVLVLFEPQDWQADVRVLRRAVSDAWNDLDCPETGQPLIDFDGFVRHRVRAMRKSVERYSGPVRSALERFRDRRSVLPDDAMASATTPVNVAQDDRQLLPTMSTDDVGS